MIPVYYVHIGLGILIVLVSIPLMLRKVPMNCVYGVRIRKAFTSERNWYEVNAYGGKLLIEFGLFLCLFSYLSKDIAPPPESPWAPVSMIVPLLGFLPILVLIYAFAHRLPDRADDD